jgi:hypothetical protein
VWHKQPATAKLYQIRLTPKASQGSLELSAGLLHSTPPPPKQEAQSHARLRITQQRLVGVCRHRSAQAPYCSSYFRNEKQPKTCKPQSSKYPGPALPAAPRLASQCRHVPTARVHRNKFRSELGSKRGPRGIFPIPQFPFCPFAKHPPRILGAVYERGRLPGSSAGTCRLVRVYYCENTGQPLEFNILRWAGGLWVWGLRAPGQGRSAGAGRNNSAPGSGSGGPERLPLPPRPGRPSCRGRGKR